MVCCASLHLAARGFLCVINPDTMDQPHVWLKNYQNVNLDLIWVDKLHNFTLKLREHWSTHRSLSPALCSHTCSSWEQ